MSSRVAVQPSFALPSQTWAASWYRLVLLLAGVSVPAWLYGLFYHQEEQFDSGFILVPLLLTINFVAVTYLARNDRVLRSIVPAALLFKIAASGFYTYWCFGGFLGNPADSTNDLTGYYEMARHVVNDFMTRGDWRVFIPSTGLLGSPNQLVARLLALMFLGTGASLSTGMATFAMIGFWGQFLCYRAFCVAFPRGRRDLAAVGLMLLPSLVFWSSSIGKDAIADFSIALTLYGFVLLHTRPGPKAYVFMTLGLVGCTLIRVHIAGMVVSAILFPYAVSKNPRGLRDAAPKILATVLLAFTVFYVVSRAQTVLNVVDVASGMRYVNVHSRNTNVGRSAFGGDLSLPERLLSAPVLLFRPFPWEVRSLTGLITSLEGLGLMLFFVLRRRALRAALDDWRSSPMVTFILFYAVEFTLVFAAAITNFGILARERVMLLPYVYILFCICDAPKRRGAFLGAYQPAQTGALQPPAESFARISR